MVKDAVPILTPTLEDTGDGSVACVDQLVHLEPYMLGSCSRAP